MEPKSESYEPNHWETGGYAPIGATRPRSRGARAPFPVSLAGSGSGAYPQFYVRTPPRRRRRHARVATIDARRLGSAPHVAGNSAWRGSYLCRPLRLAFRFDEGRMNRTTLGSIVLLAPALLAAQPSSQPSATAGSSLAKTKAMRGGRSRRKASRRSSR